MLRKFLCSALLFLLLSAPACASAPAPVLHTTHRIEQQTFLEHDTCSATAIGHHALLTDTHCELGSDDLFVDGNKAVIQARIRDGYDHTIYIVDAYFSEYALLHDFKKSEPQPGDDIWIRGNPGGFQNLVRHGTYAGTAVKPEINGLSITFKQTHWYDLNGFMGDSGAGIFDAEGDVIDTVSVINRTSEGAFSFQLSGGFGLHFSADQLKQAAQ